jgi:Ser/Thr protein kinase RdoA (MazF antagonist)
MERTLLATGPGYEMVQGEGNTVIKFFPPGTPRSVAERELEFTKLVRQYGLEAPFPHHVIEEDGRFGVVFDKVIGPSYTQWMAEHPTWHRKLTEYFAHEHHEVHMHKVMELPRLKEVLKERIQKNGQISEAEREQALAKLASMPEGEWLCHMNYVPDSIMVSLDGPVVFHWGGAVRGDYLADVARTSLLLEDWEKQGKGGDVDERARGLFARGYVTEYIKICGRMDEELEDWKRLLKL